MSNLFRAPVAVSMLTVLVGSGLGCTSPTAPKAAPTAPLVASITPSEGLAGVPMKVTITGIRLLAGATVAIGGSASDVQVLNGTNGPFIIATTPAHASTGFVDVVVTNPNGESGTLKAGFRYGSVALTISGGSDGPPSTVNVSWVAPGRTTPGINGDWIGLFRVGDPNTVEASHQSTTGVSGTLTFRTPAQAGDYEFRYLVDDGFIDVARSTVITVMTAPPAPPPPDRPLH